MVSETLGAEIKFLNFKVGPPEDGTGDAWDFNTAVLMQPQPPEKRSTVVQVRMTPAEVAKLSAEAREHHLALSSYVRLRLNGEL